MHLFPGCGFNWGRCWVATIRAKNTKLEFELVLWERSRSGVSNFFPLHPPIYNFFWAAKTTTTFEKDNLGFVHIYCKKFVFGFFLGGGVLVFLKLNIPHFINKKQGYDKKTILLPLLQFVWRHNLLLLVSMLQKTAQLLKLPFLWAL